jgi:hemoglobin-like flavoprotein
MSPTEDFLNLFNDSFERCSRDPQFLDRFYALFIGSNDEIRGLFRNTDMTKQKEMLMISLSYMMLAHSNPNLLDQIAEKHDRNNLDIKPHQYALWLECMLAAVHQTDPEFSREVAAAWRSALQPGIDYLISRYDPENGNSG